MTKEKEEKKTKNLKTGLSLGASCLNTNFNTDGGACQKFTPSLKVCKAWPRNLRNGYLLEPHVGKKC